MTALTHLDLFSGIGGWALAAKWAAINTVAFCEKDKFCRKVLNKNFPDIPVAGDIKGFYPQEKYNLITASMPCQPFSVAGKRKGKDDDRYLWPETIRIIKQCKPTWVVIENVVGIVAMELDNMLTDLETQAYETRQFIIPACAANAPHRRDRLWVIAHLNSQRCTSGFNYGKKRPIQKNKKRNLATIQSEWPQFQPQSWASMRAGDWLSFNAQASRIDDGFSTRLDRCKALGNAIVPQVAYPILKIIAEIEKGHIDNQV